MHMAFSINEVVRVACQSRSWLNLCDQQATHTTSLTLKTMQERNLCSQGLPSPSLHSRPSTLRAEVSFLHMAFSINEVVRVACQSRSWLNLCDQQATHTTSLTLKTMQERNLCSQGLPSPSSLVDKMADNHIFPSCIPCVPKKHLKCISQNSRRAFRLGK